MKNKFRFFFVALTGALLLTGCVKDDPDAYFIKLLAEGYTPGSNSKAIVGDAEHGDETVTYWADGDSLWINGYWYEVDVSGKDAVAKGVYMEEASDVYRAVYPKSVHNGGISGDKVTIKVPNKYIYAESKGRQVLDGLPLVAYSSTKPTEKQGLAFKHITAAITVRVKNTYEVTIDTTMKTNDSLQNLCGLFSRPEGDNVTVCNLTLDDVDLVFGHADLKAINYDDYHQSAVGGIFGYVGNTYTGTKDDQIIKDTITDTKIVKCHVKNIRIKSKTPLTDIEKDALEVDEYAGGIVGLVNSNLLIEDCSVDGVFIDNTIDDVNGNLFDQFGGAIGRIDVDKNHILGKTPTTWVVIKNFTYNQGNDYLVFDGNLKNVRYGGVIANVTRAGKVYLRDIEVIHKVEFNPLAAKTDACLYAGGIIGCCKGPKWKLHASGKIHCYGVVNNKSFNNYDDLHQINRYVSCAPKKDFPQKNDNYFDGINPSVSCSSLSYCNTPASYSGNSSITMFHVLKNSVVADTFQWQYESFFDKKLGTGPDQRPPVNS